MNARRLISSKARGLSTEGALPPYLASIPVLHRWMSGWKNPTRAEQDRLAEDIRLARIAARIAVGLCGGRVLAAYVAALRSFLLKDDILVRKATAAEAEAWGIKPGAKVRFALDGVTLAGDDRLLADGEVGRRMIEARERCGNQNRGSAGVKTREALRLLAQLDGPPEGANGALIAQVAAELDLVADPSCRALDAALADLGMRPKTDRELETQRAILAFEQAVGRAQHALRGQVVEVLRLASMADHLEGPFGGDALTGGAEGQRRAFRVYQRNGPGDLCLGSFARTHWIVQGAVRALRGVWSSDSEAGRAGYTLLSLDYQQDEAAEDTEVVGDPRGDEGAAVRAEEAELPLVLEHVLSCLGEGAENARRALCGELELKWDRAGNLSKKTTEALPPTLLRRLRDHVLQQLEPEIYRPRPSHLGVWKPRAPAQIRTMVAPPVQRTAPAWEPWAALRDLCEQAFACPI